MIKNIGKFKQWTGEKIGRPPKTRMDEDFNILTDETEAKRIALEKLNEASQAYLKAMSKRIEGEDKFKGLAIETFGVSMSAQSQTLREGSTYRQALLRMGDAHQNMGVAQTELINSFAHSYIECLAKAQAQMKEFQVLQKKLQSKRLDYDAKLVKVQKAKKEKPEWEEEMQAAKSKYEDTRECVLGIMIAISDSQDEDVHSLKQYYDAQLAYARKAVEILEGIPESTFICTPNGSQSSLHKGTSGNQNLCRQFSRESDESHSVHSDDNSAAHSVPTRRMHRERTPSTTDLKSQNSFQHGNPDMSRSMSHLNPGAHPLRRNGSIVAIAPAAAPPPPMPSMQAAHQKQVKALFNFEATAEGELSIHRGDIIGIVEEIDEGWWVGELVDENGVRQEGMFPSNYCEKLSEEFNATERRQSMNPTLSEPGRYMDEDAAAYYERESEPTVHYKEREPLHQPLPISVARKAPPPPTPARNILAPEPLVSYAPSSHHSTLSNGSEILSSTSAAAVRATPPPSRPMSTSSPLNRVPTIGSRAPPPPPPSRRTAMVTAAAAAETRDNSHDVVHVPPNTSPQELRQSGIPTGIPTGTMGGYIPRDYVASQPGNNIETTVGRCRECDCDDFAPN
ncbi:hypothetical protein BG004_005117, partial [Podila humilis]